MSLLREPLLHFTVAGAILFGAYAGLEDEQPEASAVEPVRVEEGDIAWLKQAWSGQWQREPTAEELKGLVGEFVDEQLLAREAGELGLAEGDTIIRRRLAQKLQFLVEDTAHLAEPPEQELRAFHAANAQRFATSAKISFEQRYFNPESRDDAASDAAAALAELSVGGESALTAGDRLLLGDSFAEINDLAVASMFGADFAREAFALEPGRWQGPVGSGYGLHLLLIRQRSPAEPMPFESVREAVLTEWLGARRSALAREYLDKLRAKYGVELDDSAKAALEFASAPGQAGEPAPEVAAR